MITIAKIPARSGASKATIVRATLAIFSAVATIEFAVPKVRDVDKPRVATVKSRIPRSIKSPMDHIGFRFRKCRDQNDYPVESS